MPVPLIAGAGAVATAVGGWFARRTIAQLVIGGITSVWTFFKSSKWFQGTVFTSVITDSLGGLMQDTSDSSKAITTIIGWVCFAMILFFTLPAIIKYINKKI